MNKKFASLGTALSRDEAKKVMGGNTEFEFEGGCGDSCITNNDCPVDRECKSGDCQGVTVKACFRYN